MLTQVPLIVDDELLQTIKMGLLALQYQAKSALDRVNAQVNAAVAQAESPPPHKEE